MDSYFINKQLNVNNFPCLRNKGEKSECVLTLKDSKKFGKQVFKNRQIKCFVNIFSVLNSLLLFTENESIFFLISNYKI
jgi:hypothetical protein